MLELLKKPIAKWLAATSCALSAILLVASLPPPDFREIEVLADKDSRYKMEDQRNAEMQVKPGEHLLLRITARKAKSQTRDGSVHGFTLVRARDWAKVPGWDLSLKSGTQEFRLTAPDEPGDYWVLCTVVCSEDHEGMRMKLVVAP